MEIILNGTIHIKSLSYIKKNPFLMTTSEFIEKQHEY